MWEQRLREIQARQLEIRGMLETDGECNVEELTAELRSLATETESIQRRMAALADLQQAADNGQESGEGDHAPQRRGVDPVLEGVRARGDGLSPGLGGDPWAEVAGGDGNDAETRANNFAKNKRATVKAGTLKRALTLATGQIAQPTRVGNLSPLPNSISAIIDMVNVVDASGMGEDRVPYQKTEATAGVKKDGTATPESANEFDFVVIKPVLVSTLSYISKNVPRTTPVNYKARTTECAVRALRREISRMIVNGDPSKTIPEICGIINAKTVTTAKDLPVSAINQFTLRNIALGYGGDDYIEGGCVLMLNKEDLIAFGDVRGTNEKKYVYEIEYAEGSTTTGIIKDGGLAVPFVINATCKALSNKDVAVDEYTMLYGKSLAYQLDLFGDFEIEVSRDYKFAEGLLAVLGEVMVGGNVIALDGWTRVKKAAA